MGCFDIAYYSLYKSCNAGYNFSYGECCSYAWIEFGWWVFGFVIFFILISVICAVKRRRMQQQQMYYQNMAALGQPRQEVIITSTTTNQQPGTYAPGAYGQTQAYGAQPQAYGAQPQAYGAQPAYGQPQQQNAYGY